MHSKFAKDSYGLDKLSKVLFIVGIFFLVITYGRLLGIILIIFVFYRTISHNKINREKEAKMFEKWKSKINYKLKTYNYYEQLSLLNERLSSLNEKYGKKISRLKNKRQCIVIACPRCSQKLRLPKGKGKIIVTCSTCKCEFRLKT